MANGKRKLVFHFILYYFFFIETHLFRVHVTYLQKNYLESNTGLQYIAYYLQRKH